jgi:hypothetical protein
MDKVKLASVKQVLQAKWKVLLLKEMLDLSTSSAVRSSSPCWIHSAQL